MVKTLRKFIVASVLSITALFSQTALAESNPYTVMQQTADKLFSDIKNNQSKIKADPNYLRTIVRNDLIPHIYVQYAGMLVLSKNKATDEQRSKFFNAFGQFIEQSYAQILTQYTDQKVQVESEKPLDNKEVVSIRVTVLSSGNSQPIRLDFKWRKNKAGDWKAYDMAAEGVSMVATKQNEWSGILRQQGIDALTAQVEQSARQPITLRK